MSKGCYADDHYFCSYTEASKFLKSQGIKHTQKTIINNISKSIDKNILCYNYKWYSAKEECPIGYTLEIVKPKVINSNLTKSERSYKLKSEENNDIILLEMNEEVKNLRKEAYEESLGVKSMLYKILPQLYSKEDIRKMQYNDAEEYNLIIETDKGLVKANDIAEVAGLIKMNLTATEILNAIETKNLNGHFFDMSSEYKEKLKKFLKGV